MDDYLKKRVVSLQEPSPEIMTRMMGKTTDVVKFTLHSIPSLRSAENPKLISDILNQHISKVTYSSVTLADFYNTLSVTRESSVDY